MSRLIFGSCSSQHYDEQPLWPVIQSRNATAFVWGGDSVYADDRTDNQPMHLDGTPEYLRQLFDDQKRQSGYKALLESNISIFGAIDDHDYGRNNGDRTFPWRKENAVEFVRFLNLAEDSPMFRRAVNGQGIYGVQVYDFNRPDGSRLLSDNEAGLDPDVVPDEERDPTDRYDKQVAVFVLDVRSNRTPWRKTFPERFQPDKDGDMLGEEQWRWFETALGRSQAAVNVVVTGLQVHPERFYDPGLVENWSGFPVSQHRLYQALLQPNVQAPILVTGDVHHAQLMRKDCRRQETTTDDHSSQFTIRPIYEVTTSGMTHSWGTQVCGRSTNNPLCHSWYYRTMFRSLMQLAHKINPWTELLLDHTQEQLQYSLDLNVAELEFDWGHQTVSVNILGVENRILLQQHWSMQDLTQIQQTNVNDHDFKIVQQSLEGSKFGQSEEWVCVHYRGFPNRIHFAVGLATPMVLMFTIGTLPIWLSLFLVWKIVMILRRQFSRRASTKPPLTKPKLS